MPPISIVIASFWLASGILLGLARLTAEFLNSSQNPMQIGWFVLIALLGLTNIVSVVFFFFQKPKAHIYYYGSLLLLFISGTVFFVLHAQSGQQVGTFAAQCFASALIFTIAYLPYRDRFTKEKTLSSAST